MLIKFLFFYLKFFPLKSLLLIGSLLTSIVLQLILPQILRQFIDILQKGDGFEELHSTATFFLGLAIATQLITVLTLYVAGLVSWGATSDLRVDLVRHCLHLDMSFHKAHTSGEMIERLDGDVTVLANFFPKFIINLIGNAGLYVCILCLLFFEDWRIGGMLTFLSLITIILSMKLQGIAVNYFQKVRQASANFFGFLEEHLAGIDDIRTCGGIPYVMRQLYQKMRQRVYLERTAYCMNIMTVLGVIEGFFTLAFVVLCVFGTQLYLKQAITIGTIYVIFYYINMLRDPLDRITHQMPDLQKALASLARIDELLVTKSQVKDGTGVDLPSKPLSLEFNKVSFSYDGKLNVLDQISFELKPGKVLGLLGRTGSGKTTIARLLLRFYNANQGTINLDGFDIKEARLADLRNKIGFVTQDVQFFHGTVRDNITFFDHTITDEKILEVMHELGLWDWHSSLPNGINTILESGNKGLSAGEAQLLALVRIFLRNPSVVILDEASSRLDPATEHLLGKSVQKMMINRTGIIIAHRLKTVQWVDEIMILDHGHIVEHGSRMNLTKDASSYFNQLLKKGIETLDGESKRTFANVSLATL